MVSVSDNHNYYMMNIVDYLLGNTDHHWANCQPLFHWEHKSQREAALEAVHRIDLCQKEEICRNA